MDRVSDYLVMKATHKAEHEHFMKRALSLARKGAGTGEVPIAAVLVIDGKVVEESYNLTRTHHDPTAHAEMVVLQAAGRRLENERLLGSTLYVTLEPCAMCAGAIIQARVGTVVFAAYDEKAGACGSALTVIPHRKLNHRPPVIKGLLAAEAAVLLSDFFRERRRQRKLQKKVL
jgi:tRNA(adenine34) deaminase